MHILEETKKYHEYLVNIRRDFHRHPELSMKEYRTAERIEEELDKLGIPHHRSAGTGVIGILKGTGPGSGDAIPGLDESTSHIGVGASKRVPKERIIGLRADIDALPILESDDRDYQSLYAGVMHACGHDLHNTCLLGAAKVLSEHTDAFAGTVKFIFQPGEEIGKGAQEMVADNEMDGVERMFGLHVAPDLKTGQVGIKVGANNASVDHFKIEIKGKASHVSTPHLGVDSVYIAAQIVVALQALVTRTISPIDPVIIGVGILQAGTSYNIVAKDALLEGTTRTTSPKTRKETNEKITELVKSIASLYGGEATITWTDYTSALINDVQASKEVDQVVEELLGKDALIKDRVLSLGGDNFAEFILKVPGVYAYLGTSNENNPNTQRMLHNEGFDVDEDALDIGVALYVSYALKWLNSMFK